MPAKTPARAKSPARAGNPPKAAAPASKPLVVFLTEPGLGDLALLELKHRKIAPRKARPLRLRMRNHDVLVLPGALLAPKPDRSRLCTNVLSSPLFGRNAITPRQLDALAALFRAGSYKRIVSSVAGDRFGRPDLMRWLGRELARRGVALAENGRALWLLVIDEHFYLAEEIQNHHDAPGRGQAQTRSGALPPVVAAAMAFAARPGPGEVVWDPTAGTGNLIGEVLALAPDARVLASDIDSEAVAVLQRRFSGRADAWIAQADAGTVDLPAALTLTIANLPFGKRYQASGGSADFYKAVMANALRHAGPAWRGVFLTSDVAAISAAARANDLALAPAAEITLRGLAATIWRVERKP